MYYSIMCDKHKVHKTMDKKVTVKAQNSCKMKEQNENNEYY